MINELRKVCRFDNYKIEFIDFVFRLFKAAEEARLPKRLRPELGGALREFTTRESHCFSQIKNSDGTLTLFTSQERQWLVLQVLQGLRAGENDLDALQDSASVAEGQSIGMNYHYVYVKHLNGLKLIFVIISCHVLTSRCLATKQFDTTNISVT